VAALYLDYVQVQLLGESSRLLLAFFVRTNGIDRKRGDVGCCGDVSILGRVLTSASKGNWHMMTSSSGNTSPLWLLV